MIVWFSVVASSAYMYMSTIGDELGKVGTAILAFICITTFFGGMIYESNKEDKIKKLENEVKKLKENSKEI